MNYQSVLHSVVCCNLCAYLINKILSIKDLASGYILSQEPFREHVRAMVLGMPFPLSATTVTCLVAKESETFEVFTVALTAILMQIGIKIKRSKF